MSRAVGTVLVLASSIVATAALAHAEPLVISGGGVEHDLRDDIRAGRGRMFGELGYLGGKREVGPELADHFGLLLGFGLQRGHYALIGELHIGHLRTEPEPTLSGFAGDASVHVRRDAGSWLLGDDSLAATIGLFVDAGAGVQLMWFDNDTVYRPEVSVGIGGGFEFIGRRRSLGVTFDVRVVATPAVEWDVAAGRCAGGCSMTFSTIDFTTLGVIAFPFTL